MDQIDEIVFSAIGLCALIIALFGAASIWMALSKRGKK